MSYQLGRLNKIAIPDLYLVINDLLKIFLRSRGREVHRVVFMKAHATSNYKHQVNERIQIIKPISCGCLMMEGFLVA